MTGPLTTQKTDNPFLLYAAAAGTAAALILVRIFFRDRYIVPVIVLLMISGLFYALTVLLIQRRTRPLPLPVFTAVFAASVLVRLIFFSASPDVLSDDVYRYLWDGKLQTEGINPYLYAPENPGLEELRDDPLYGDVAHTAYLTSYPPVSQYLFRGAYALGRGRLYPLRLFYLLAEGGIIIILLLKLKKNRDKLLIYLLCPLVIIEVYAGMHIDIIGAALLTAAWFFFSKQKYFLFTVCFVVSVLVKYVSLVTLPVFMAVYLKNNGVTGKLLLYTASGFLLTFVLFLPFIEAGSLLFSQLEIYSKFWRFNGSLYPILQGAAGSPYAGWIRLLLTAGAIGFTALHPDIPLPKKMVLCVLVFFLLSPVLYPWYLLWMAPFLVYRPRKGEIALIVLIMLSYYVLPDYKTAGVWKENPIFILIQYVPFYLLFFHDIIRGRYVQK